MLRALPNVVRDDGLYLHAGGQPRLHGTRGQPLGIGRAGDRGGDDGDGGHDF
jgi:hypothetical protein